tara:strand:+ start:95 stop:529 length:435 start_codon:yes stop_codon:yes gene_type:complete
MQLLLILLSIATINPLNCDKEFIRTYKLAAEWIYPENMDIGPLIEFDDHNCDGWLPGYKYPGKVAIRPLYADNGLPLYDMFEDEWEDLIGFEFRILHIIAYTCRLAKLTKDIEAWECWENYHEYWNGYSIQLSEQEKFLYSLME